MHWTIESNFAPVRMGACFGVFVAPHRDEAVMITQTGTQNF